ncbi:phytoene/squalene synthase family protein [Aquiluna borgnonia]|uniref:Phytoene/squalene synthase family protein n=1 Tax=Aquiluna borgnonia TaxID=2499157 RepID=A0A7D4UDI1_9MICO|nr:phytoene/squalene synthase family protein [Aquiluna borgnonia]QKJ25574.1 phytoene/squalene synthase family protein [Aquiluna borgnonia]
MESQDTTKVPTGLHLYNLAAHQASREVIYSYSTSFGLATRLLDSSIRHHVENIYAMVRVADEIVDGSAAEAALREPSINPSVELDSFEAETYRAMELGYSTNLVCHAFGQSAREVGIGKDIVEPFFYSMRQDLTESEHDQASFDRYVYGSAEVVGLMCLAAFVHGSKFSTEEKVTLVKGARALGAAFQKVNFLRDLAADFKRLGRSYFPDVNVNNFDEQTKARLVADIEQDLKTSAASLPLLPGSAKRAVTAAQLLFGELNQKISKTPAEELINQRISVGTLSKLWLLAKALLGVKP